MGVDGYLVRQQTNEQRPLLKINRLYTFSVYIGSSIYTPGEQGIMDRFGVSPTASVVGMSLYVLSCLCFPYLYRVEE